MSKIYQALDQLDRRPAASIAPARRFPARRGIGEPATYERLGTKVVQALRSAPFRTLMITAPDHGEGTSTVAMGLATSLADRNGLSVLLVDANIRHQASDFPSDQPEGGLASALAEAISLDDLVVETDLPRLALLPAGDMTSGSASAFDTSRFDVVRDDLVARADLVIFDAAPVLPYADALILALKVERVILVTQADHTHRGRLEQATAELHRSNASILGVVLNRKASHAPPWLARRFNL